MISCPPWKVSLPTVELWSIWNRIFLTGFHLDFFCVCGYTNHKASPVITIDSWCVNHSKCRGWWHRGIPTLLFWLVLCVPNWMIVSMDRLKGLVLQDNSEDLMVKTIGFPLKIFPTNLIQLLTPNIPLLSGSDSISTSMSVWNLHEIQVPDLWVLRIPRISSYDFLCWS